MAVQHMNTLLFWSDNLHLLDCSVTLAMLTQTDSD